MTVDEARRVLGLGSSPSTVADIERAFRRSAKHDHPDVQRDAGARHAAEERFRRVLEARRMLRAMAAAPPPSFSAQRRPATNRTAPGRRQRPLGNASVERTVAGCGGWVIAGWAALVLFSPWWVLLPAAVTLVWARRRGPWSREGLQAAAIEVGRAMAVAGVAAAAAITLVSVL